MRFTSVPRTPKNYSEWHRKFVIWPRKIQGTDKFAYLETVMRKGTYHDIDNDFGFDVHGPGSFWTWQYSGLENEEALTKKTQK